MTALGRSYAGCGPIASVCVTLGTLRFYVHGQSCVSSVSVYEPNGEVCLGTKARRKMVQDLAEVTEGNGPHLRSHPSAHRIRKRSKYAAEAWSRRDGPLRPFIEMMMDGVTFQSTLRPQTSKARASYDIRRHVCDAPRAFLRFSEVWGACL